MPPPTLVDPWLAGRHFGIVIDSGSSGSRLQIYSWRDPRTVILEKGSALVHSLPKVEKGAKENEEWVSKVEPGVFRSYFIVHATKFLDASVLLGISSFADDPEGVAGHLRPLLSYAREHIPPSLQYETPLFLLATAGMRLIPPARQAEVLQQACLFLKAHSHFRIDEPSPAGPCGSSVRIITGEEEGLFGWIAVNYLMDGFTGSSGSRTTYGFLDMGGASTQIAFEPSKAHRGNAKNLIDVRLRLLGGEEIRHKVFVTTWLGYGTNQARERYVGKAINEYEQSRSEDVTSTEDEVIPDPCLPKDLQLTESPVHVGPSTPHTRKPHRLLGTGNFEKCMKSTSSLLNKNSPCPDTPCLMNGVHVPPIDFSVSHFIGVSEYWYSSEHVFGLGGPYDFVQYERAASKFCARQWSGIVKQHEQSRQQHRLGGDGEVEKDGRVVDIGRWGDQVELSRLEMQCFKAAWIANVLHEGIGMPRIVDPGGNLSTDGDNVAKQAENKGLGRPSFQSVDTVGDIAISWTLGKMVLEASKQVPLLSKTDRPLVDPLDDIPDTANSPIRPIRPPFLNFGPIDDRISPHLPASLTRTSLGFSPVGFVFYAILFCGFVLLSCRLRRQVRTSCLRSIRSVARRDTEGYSMEEGKVLNGGNRTASPPTSTRTWLRPLRRLLPYARQPPLNLTTNHPNLRYAHTSPAHTSPNRSYSLPNNFASSTKYTHASISRSPSPSPAFFEDNDMSGSLSSLSARSRNASQLNLSLTPRPATISRVNSTMYMAGGGSLRDE